MIDNSKIRVLELAGAWGLGGSEQAIQLRCMLLDKSRYEMMAVGIQSGGPRLDVLKKIGIQTAVCNGSLVELDSLVAKFKPHIIAYGRSSSFSKLAKELSPIIERRGTPIVVETNVFGRPALEGLSRQPDLIAHMSGASRLKCARAMGISSSELASQGHSVVYLPVPTRLYSDARVELNRSKAREKLGLKDSDFIACRVARPAIRKWSARLEVALPNLFRAIPNLRFIFQAVPETKRRALEQKYGDRVICREATSDIHQLALTYAASDIMIHSSGIGESFGLCVAEAMYFGLPVIVDSTPSLDNAQVELVANGSTGYVVKSVEGFVSGAQKLAENEQLRQEFGSQAKSTAEQYFVDTEIARQWDAIYSQLISTQADESKSSVLPEPKSLVVSEIEYEERLQDILGPSPSWVEEFSIARVKALDTLLYIGQVGPRKLFEILGSRLKAGKIGRT